MPLHLKDFAEPYRVADGKKFRLKDFHPGDTWKCKSKEDAHDLLAHSLERLREMQEKLYAQDNWSLLLIFQAMDAAGKDSTIKHVMSGVNPQGCEVYSFKAPTSAELDHGYLWRCHQLMPQRGRIGIFNRSYYEEVLVVRVHPELLDKQKIPPDLVTKNIWKERCEDIAALERYAGRNGTVIRKFFLNVSKKEQKERFLSRLDEPDKNWKFEPADLNERKYWPQYMDAFEDMIRHTATQNAPWYVVPADHKWFTRLVVASVVIETLESLDLKYPKLSPARRRELAASRTALTREK